jgi:hypothetical protein
MGGYAVYTQECHADACGGERVLGGSCNRVLQLERARGGGGAGGGGGVGSVAPEQVGGGGAVSAAAVAADADPPAAEVRSFCLLYWYKKTNTGQAFECLRWWTRQGGGGHAPGGGRG